MPASKGPLSVVNPSLAAQWSPRNTLTPDNVSVSSRTKVLWVCCKGHEWEASVRDRHGGTGCPFCTNRRVLAGFNDLATVAPHLVAEWHPTKNTVTPSDVLAASTKKAWWRCGHGHEWETRIDLRVKKGLGCGVCNGKRTLTGVNDLVTRFPEIAAEWHPTKNGGVSPSSVSGSSGTKYWWLGACGHEWEANVRNRTYNKSGCPVCAGTMIVSGINDLATLYPRVAAQWHPSRNHLHADQVSPGSEKDAWWLCAVCGHEWQAKPSSRVNAAGAACPLCTNQVVLKGINDLFTCEPRAKEEWSPRNTVDPHALSGRSGVKVWWRCATCAHEWKASPASRFGDRAYGCPSCAGIVPQVGVNDLATTHPDLARELADADPTTLKAGSGVVRWRCSTCDQTWSSSVYVRVNRGDGCPVCANKVVVKGVNDLATLRPDLAKEWSPSNDVGADEVVPGSGYRAEWVCSTDPSHMWKTTVSNRHRIGSQCPECSSNLRTSRGERELADFIEKVLEGTPYTVERNVRGLIGGKLELDILVRGMNIAFEFNGSFYHSEKFRDPRYHADKLAACTSAGIRLIQVWEDDWALRKDVWKRMIRHRLNKSTDAVVYARNTRIVNVPGALAEDFLDSNHVQGSAAMCAYYGLESKDGTLVAVMAMKARQDDAELVRYATSAHVPGGFSKLLKHVEREYASRGAKRIITFADLEISNGNLYRATGFRMDAELPPDYKYLIPTTMRREHKFGFRKERFKNDPDLDYIDGFTERQLAELNGLYRCYDSGKLRFVKEIGGCP